MMFLGGRPGLLSWVLTLSWALAPLGALGAPYQILEAQFASARPPQDSELVQGWHSCRCYNAYSGDRAMNLAYLGWIGQGRGYRGYFARALGKASSYFDRVTPEERQKLQVAWEDFEPAVPETRVQNGSLHMPWVTDRSDQYFDYRQSPSGAILKFNRTSVTVFGTEQITEFCVFQQPLEVL